MESVSGNGRLRWAALFGLATLLLAVPLPALAPIGGPLVWVSQFGTSGDDNGYGFGPGVAAGASGVYVAGGTFGTFPGQTNAGGLDAFLSKFDANGNAVWTRQFGTAADDKGLGVAVGTSGVYVAGWAGAFPGQVSPGAFLRKYDVNGNVLWTREVGALGDIAYGVAIGASGVYIAGQLGPDAFVAKYDENGNFYWIRAFGISDFDFAYAVAVDLSGEYVVGSMKNGAQHDDAFVWKYDANGNVLWTSLFGSQAGYPDAAYGVAFDSSGVCVAGTTSGALPGQTSAGLQDAFLRKYDANGNEVWTRQFGSPADDFGLDVAGGGLVGCYVGGETWGTLFQPNAGGLDAFIELYDPSGNLAWLVQFGTPLDDGAWGVAVNGSPLYVAGITDGRLGDVSFGMTDAYVARAL